MTTFVGMYEGSSCPACTGTLVPLEAPVALLGCGSCGGAWLGPDASGAVMRGTGDALESELAHAACRVRAAGGTFAKHARVCPTCNAALSTFAIAGVEIDSCPAHGTWFDRDEIGKIVAECRRAKKKSGAPEGASIGHAVGFFAGVPGLLADGIYAMFKNAFSGESTDWD